MTSHRFPLETPKVTACHPSCLPVIPLTNTCCPTSPAVRSKYLTTMPSPSESSSVVSVSGSRALSGGRRGSARLLLYLGLCHLGLGAMVLAFSFTSLAFTSSPRVRQSLPFWAGFFVSYSLLYFLSLIPRFIAS